MASPSDVGDERAALAQIVDELNRTVCVDIKIALELVRWETHVAPDLGRPQGVVNRQVGQFDVFIGIMWKRFGTPTGRAEAGTEEDFNLALKSWKTSRAPRIMFYFNQAPYTLRSVEETEQIRKVLQFRRRVERYGIIGEYTGSNEFKDRVREHLIAALRDIRQPSTGQGTPSGLNSVQLDDGGPPNSLQNYVDEFLPTKSERTASTYRLALRQVAEFLQSEDALDGWTPEDLRPTFLRGFYFWLTKKYASKQGGTIETYLAGARAFVLFQSQHGRLAKGTTYDQMRVQLRAVQGPSSRSAKTLHQSLPDVVARVVREVQLLPVAPAHQRKGVARLETLRDKALLLTLYCTGLRRNEVSRLNREQVSTSPSTGVFISDERGQERVVFLSRAAAAAIDAYLEARSDGRRPLFLRHDNRRGRMSGVSGEGWRLSAQSVWAIVRTRSLRAIGKALTPRDLREAFRMRMINKGASAPIVDVLLGRSERAIYDDDQVARLRQEFEEYGPAA